MILLDLPGGRTKDPRKVRTKHVLDVVLRCCTQFHASRLQKHVAGTVDPDEPARFSDGK
jgi:hypothetical protein